MITERRQRGNRTLPLEKMLQAGPLTLTPSQGPLAAFLAPVWLGKITRFTDRNVAHNKRCFCKRGKQQCVCPSLSLIFMQG